MNDKPLDENLSIFMEKLQLLPEDEAIRLAELYINQNLKKQSVLQSRFMSTAMTNKAAQKYAEKVLWEIEIPAGSKGASIESFNIERKSEAEFLLQKNSKLVINGGIYDPKNKILKLKAKIVQAGIIDNNVNNVKIKQGV